MGMKYDMFLLICLYTVYMYVFIRYLCTVYIWVKLESHFTKILDRVTMDYGRLKYNSLPTW